MERPTSENDKPGYIYAYQLLESKLPYFVFSFLFRGLLHTHIYKAFIRNRAYSSDSNALILTN